MEEALIIIRGKKILKVDKMDYSKHPEYSKLRSCKASAHVPQWRLLEQEARAAPKAEKKTAASKGTKNSKQAATSKPHKPNSNVPLPESDNNSSLADAAGNRTTTTTALSERNGVTTPDKKDVSDTPAGIVLTDKDSIMS